MDYSTAARRLEGTGEGFIFSLDSLYVRLSQLTDRRRRQGTRYPLAFVLLALIVAKLGGADKPKAIAEWVAERAALFAETFELKRSAMPHHNTYRRVMQAGVDPAELQRLFDSFLADLPQTGLPVQVALDGKTLRGTLVWGKTRGLHLLAAYWPEAGLVLAQVEVDPTTNEIGAAPLVLKSLDLKGKIITGDAIFAQRDLSLLIGQAGGDFVWTVKDNQPQLRADIEKLFVPDASLVKGFSSGPTDERRAQLVNKGHGRLETRTLTVTSQLQTTSNWPFLAQVFRLERVAHLTARGSTRHETVYGLTSLTAEQAGPERLAELVRAHWHIENGLHYRRDVTLQEDATRMNNWRSAHVLALINNLVLTLLVRAGYHSLPQARRHFDAHPDHAIQLLVGPPALE